MSGRANEVLTVAYVWNQRIIRVDDRLYAMTPNILDLMLAFEAHGRVVICAPTGRAAEPPEGAQLIPEHIEVCELPFYASNYDLVRRAPSLAMGLIRTLLPALRGWDAVGGDGPSGFGLAAVILGILRGRTGFLYVRGHLTAMMKVEYADGSLRSRFIVGAFWPLDLIARFLTRVGVLTFVMGPALAARHRGPRVRLLRGYARREVAGEHAPPVVRPNEVRRLGYVGRLSPEKGADILLRAVAAVLAAGHDIELTVAGDGIDGPALHRLASALGISERVRFTGNLVDPAEVRAAFLDCGTVVIPSRTEGVPVAMLEAMSLGRAVIATDVGGIPSILLDDVNGLLVPPENPDRMAAAIIRLLADPGLAGLLARAAQDGARRLTVEAQAALMMSEIESASRRRNSAMQPLHVCQ